MTIQLSFSSTFTDELTPPPRKKSPLHEIFANTRSASSDGLQPMSQQTWMKEAETAYPLLYKKIQDSANQWRLGSRYFHGDLGYVKQDMDKALFWFEKAAGNGNKDAQKMLAVLYADGKYVEKNDAISQYWRLKSAQPF